MLLQAIDSEFVPRHALHDFGLMSKLMLNLFQFHE